MLLLLLAAAAAALTGGDNISYETWIESTDFPSAAMQNQTDVVYELSFDPAGKPYRCDVIVASRNPLMNKIACRSLLKRAARTPLLDIDGRALPSVTRVAVRMRYVRHGDEGTSIGNKISGSDIVATSPQISAGAKASYVHFTEIIDSAGKVEACFLDTKSGSEAIDIRACEIGAQPAFATPVRDASGNAVRGARSYDIAFYPGATESFKARIPSQ